MLNMKIKVKGWRIDLSTFFRIHWKWPFPKIYVHERFEKIAKWTSRTIVAIGIGVSLLALPTTIDFLVALLLLGLEVMVEKIVFEYSIIIIQPLPDFKIDEAQWLTNGYLFPNPAYKEEYNLQNHFGPCYKDEKYARKFFEYLKSWNQMSSDDTENNICLSFVLEEDNSYTTYIYANPNRKWIDEAFNVYQEANKVEKYGKIQQSLVMQMVYWKTLPNKKGTLFHSFVSTQDENGLFHFCPFILNDKHTFALEDLTIKKYHYSYKKRRDVNKMDIEFYYGPTIKINPKNKLDIPVNPQRVIDKLFESELNDLLDEAVRVEFSLANNYEKSPPIICLVFEDHEIAFKSYKNLLSRFSNTHSRAAFKSKGSYLNMTIKEADLFTVRAKKLEYDSDSYRKFIKSKQSKGKIVLVFGLSDGHETAFVSTQEKFSPLLLSQTKFKS
jgi:hypothetical protein